jgi:hypothetical protein
MTRPGDHETAAIERLLANRSRHTPPPELRARVLAAVEKKVPATKSGEHGGKESPRYPDLVAGTVWALIATALSLLLLVTASWQAASHRTGLATDRPMLSFARRAEAAGITLDGEPAAIVRLAGGQTSVRDADVARPHDILRSIDARSFLQGDL